MRTKDTSLDNLVECKPLKTPEITTELSDLLKKFMINVNSQPVVVEEEDENDGKTKCPCGCGQYLEDIQDENSNECDYDEYCDDDDGDNGGCSEFDDNDEPMGELPELDSELDYLHISNFALDSSNKSLVIDVMGNIAKLKFHEVDFEKIMKRREQVIKQTCSYCDVSTGVVTMYGIRMPICEEHKAHYLQHSSKRCCVCHTELDEFSFNNIACSADCFEKRVINNQGNYTYIGLDNQICLAREAADFYVLYDAAIKNPIVKTQFHYQASKLAYNFSKYMLMACCGEARHRRYDASEAKLLFEQNMGAVGLQWYRYIRNTFVGGSNNSRQRVWEKMFESNQDVSIRLAASCNLLFGAEWIDGYGGARWEQIAHVLLNYKVGNLNDVEFVDSAFGLEHNGSNQFDKIWNIASLAYVLTKAFHGDMMALKAFAHKDVNRLVNRSGVRY